MGKVFPGVVALEGVDFCVRAGEIHALMGENGAGKSTLIKVLTGVYGRDGGVIEMEGRGVNPRSPKEAEGLGISTVYQEVNLVPGMSVAENLLLGRQPSTGPFVRWRALRARARQALGRLGLEGIDVSRAAGGYSLAVQQMVAIARALDTEARVLILDEPTSSLDDAEAEGLFTVMRGLKERGMGIVFVTHFLEQVYAVGDRITVLRNGGLVGEWEVGALPRLELVGKMLGRDVGELGGGDGAGREGVMTGSGDILVEGIGLERRGVVGPLDLEVRKGEALGLAGLLGSGRTEVARLLAGADRATGGEVRMRGQRVGTGSPREAIARGVAFCSEDRKKEGIVPTLSVRENLLLAMQASRGIFSRIPAGEQAEVVERFVKLLGIKMPSGEVAIENLSGGNQQKVLLARWLCVNPEVLVLDEPTRGIDVGTKAEIERLVGELCGGGMAVVFISSELEEIVRTCARVVVLRDRKKVGELGGEEVEVDGIMRVIAAHEEGGSA